MTVTLEEIARTISVAIWDFDYTPRNPSRPDERWNQALKAARAVLDKHVGPMLEAAVEHGAEMQRDMFRQRVELTGVPRAYREEVLKSVKGE